MALAHRQPDPRRRPTRGLGAVLVFLATVSGCQTGSGSFLTAWRMSRDASLSKGPTKDELQDDRNLLARWLSPKRPPSSAATADKAPSPLILGSDGWKPMKPVPNPEADAEFQAAERLFQQGKFDDAEKAFQKLAKNRKGTPWGERGQFYLAETQYQSGKYVAARDSFEQLVSDYPGTEYLEKLVSRQYAIAERWLRQYDPDIKPEEKIAW
ncbi:MAG: tetratricopeptide repeat protein, partial [Planctomycetaceae bacterium]|nr:tetratricopeptide repeat protein [Planctomycetaceae bacterium]